MSTLRRYSEMTPQTLLALSLIVGGALLSRVLNLILGKRLRHRSHAEHLRLLNRIVMQNEGEIARLRMKLAELRVVERTVVPEIVVIPASGQGDETRLSRRAA